MPLPAAIGLGLKPEHYADILTAPPDLGFFEIHAENYMGAGGPPHAWLERIAALYPLSLHGVGLSIGGETPPDRAHLARLRALIARYRPAEFSEHLAWSSHGIFFDDLLPLPYTDQTLARIVGHIDQVQDALGCRMLLENPAPYVHFQTTNTDEIDLPAKIAARTGCGLLLAVNNVMVSATNHGFSPEAYIDRFPMGLVGEIHLGGHEVEEDATGAPLLIDTHGCGVSEDVLALYRRAGGASLPTLIEWDNDVPSFPRLLDEVARVRA